LRIPEKILLASLVLKKEHFSCFNGRNGAIITFMVGVEFQPRRGCIVTLKSRFRRKVGLAALIGATFLTGASLSDSAATAADAQGAPVKGGTLVYLEQQAHTNLYPPAGGFYPNGGILNQITDKLTYQNPKTLAIEPWIAESWTVNADATEYTFKIRKGVTFSDGTPLDAAAVAKNYDTRSSTTTIAARSSTRTP
jgi:peptide/nickel transport system substrate-binding protein